MLIRTVEDMQKIPKHADVVYLDTETHGLYPRSGSLLLVQLYINGLSYIIDYTQVKTLEPIRNLLETSLVVAHNMVFDWQWIHSTGIEMPRVACTMINEAILTAGLFLKKLSNGQGLSLADTVYRRYDIMLDKSIRDEFINYNGTISEKALEYAEDDTVVLQRLFEDQLEELRDKELIPVYDLECELIPTTARMEMVGVPFRRDELEEIRPHFVKFVKRSDQLLQDVFIENGAANVIVCEADGYWCVNTSSQPQKVAAFNAIGIDVPNLDSKTLVKWDYAHRKDTSIDYEDYTDDEDLITALENFGGYTHKALRAYAFLIGADRLLSSYIDRFLKRIEDDRLYLRFNQMGARATGRYSGDGQQMPRDDKLKRLGIDASIRSCIHAQPDMRIIGADLAAIELVILADRSGDTRLIHEIEQGDVHLVVTREVLGEFIPLAKEITEENKGKGKFKLLRDFSKTLSYGIAYDITGKELSNQAISKLGALNIKITQAQGDEMVKHWYRLFPVAGAWLQQSQMMVFDGFTDSVLGRKRFFDMNHVLKNKWTKLAAQRAGCNQRVQSTSADMIKRAMVLCDKRLDRTQAWIILTIHDEIVLESKVEYAKEAAHILEQCMEEATKSFLTRLAHTVKVRAFVSDRYDK